jgi:hypothetical protein
MGAMFLDSGFDMSVIDAFFDRHFTDFFDTDDPPTIQRHPMVFPLSLLTVVCIVRISPTQWMQ